LEKGFFHTGAVTEGKLARADLEIATVRMFPTTEALTFFNGAVEKAPDTFEALALLQVVLHPFTKTRPTVASSEERKLPTGRNQSATKLKGRSSQAITAGFINPSCAMVLEVSFTTL
jgi:hypothetical protein